VCLCHGEVRIGHRKLLVAHARAEVHARNSQRHVPKTAWRRQRPPGPHGQRAIHARPSCVGAIRRPLSRHVHTVQPLHTIRKPPNGKYAPPTLTAYMPCQEPSCACDIRRTDPRLQSAHTRGPPRAYPALRRIDTRVGEWRWGARKSHRKGCYPWRRGCFQLQFAN